MSPPLVQTQLRVKVGLYQHRFHHVSTMFDLSHFLMYVGEILRYSQRVMLEIQFQEDFRVV
jgi:hypothetical protein